MANLTLTIGGRPLKIQCSDNNVEAVKEIASTISKLIEDEKKENLTEKEEEKLREINKKLLNIRNKRVKPFFDNKSQTDLNAYVLETLLKISIILDDKKLNEETLNTIKIFNEKLSNKIYHCYQSSEIDAFLEDHVYFGLLFITLYELTADEKYLKKSAKVMTETWKLFYNDKTGFFQKNTTNQFQY